MTATANDFLTHFREAAPYIQNLSGKTLVVGISSSLLEGSTLAAIAADLRLLAGFGIRLVVVHGSRQQINRLAQAAGHTSAYHRNRRITDDDAMRYTKQACGMLHADLEAALSFKNGDSIHTAQRNRPQRIAGGNFVTARPFGVLDGIDMQHTGRVRKIDTAAVKHALDNRAIVLISPIGHSLSGRSFNLSMTDIAEAAAIALEAEKLIFITPLRGITDTEGRLISNLTVPQAQALLAQNAVPAEQQRWLHAAVNALKSRVRRCQILSGSLPGSLIGELFTRHGTGTSIAGGDFVTIRPARSRDIAGIVRLIRPLEAQGILLPRSRTYLENHIGQFSILEDDGRLCGCVALKIYPEEAAAELSCLAVAPDTRDSGHGERLLEHIIAAAAAQGINRLFALSTQTGEWFLERGFCHAPADTLPHERLAEYRQNGRASHIFVRNTASR